MEVWFHDGKLYEVNSFYCLPDDAWRYELTGLTGALGAGPHFSIRIPDATPDDGPFIPEAADQVVVDVADGELPWPILRRLLSLVQASGDLDAEIEASDAPPEQLMSANTWWHAGKRYDVNSFHFSDGGCWCCELYEVGRRAERNTYVDVQIPDASPDRGPFIPDPADRVTLTIHGDWSIPWLVLRRFLAVITASGDIVQDTTAPGTTCNK